MEWLPRDELLTFEEIERLARLLVERFGIRLDPPHRRRADRAGPPAGAGREAGGARRRPVAHHQRRHPRAVAPATWPTAGLRRVNVSLDTLRPDRFVELTRRDQLADVLRGIDAALEAGLDAGEGQRRRRARRERRRGRRASPASAATAASPSASSSGCRSTAATRGPATRSSPRRRSSSRSTRCSRSSRSPAAPSRPSGSATSTARGEVGVIPSVTRAVLRAVRPGPPHRRRPAAQLPVLRSRTTTCAGPLRSGATDDELSDAIEACVRRQVGRPRHRPGAVRQAPPLDEPDRRLSPLASPGGVRARLRPCLTVA